MSSSPTLTTIAAPLAPAEPVARPMSALTDMGAAIEHALEECPATDVLSIITGTFVSLTVELCRRQGLDVNRQIRVDGGKQRDVTIHEPKKGAPT